MLLLLQTCFCFVMRETSCCLSDYNQTDIIEAFSSTSRYIDDLLNIDNPNLNKWYIELQLNKANYSDTEAPFVDFNLSITNGFF